MSNGREKGRGWRSYQDDCSVRVLARDGRRHVEFDRIGSWGNRTQEHQELGIDFLRDLSIQVCEPSRNPWGHRFKDDATCRTGTRKVGYTNIKCSD